MPVMSGTWKRLHPRRMLAREVSELLALCYHAVSPRWRADISVTPARLEAQLRVLLRRGYRSAAFHDGVTARDGARTLAVTFDDGFRSVHEHARATLDRLGVRGTVFVGARRPMRWPGIDSWAGGPDAGKLMPMSWDEVVELADDGWEIGSHTATHPYLTSCDDATLERELRGSRERCEDRLGRPCRSLAYPYGDVDDRVAEAAAAAGYLTACALPDRMHAASPLRWPRVGVWHDDGDARFRMKVSPGLRRLRETRAWSPLASGWRSLAGSP
jgi:peptidoglycan/xylan/chitin deacetylase (PgdA/CDA1 family)